MFIQHPIRCGLIAAFCLIINCLCVACGGQESGSTQTTNVSKKAPLIVLHDPSPTQLVMLVNITMGGYDSASRNLTRIDLIFTSKGHLVQFMGHEQFVCNGKALSLHSRSMERQIAEPTSTLAGKTFHCTYSAGKNSATLAFTVPHAPVLRSLQEHARQPRRANTVVAYQTQSEQLTGIVALTSKSKAVAQLNTPGEGQATLDTSSFPAEAGTIVLTEMLAFPIIHIGTPFVSLQGRGSATAIVDVTWI